MTSASILFRDGRAIPDVAGTPDYFVDLNLGQVVDDILYGRDAFALRGIFEILPTGEDEILFRQDVMDDVVARSNEAVLRAFAAAIVSVRDALVTEDRMRHPFQKARWFLDAVTRYTEAVGTLRAGLTAAAPASAGLSAFSAVLDGYLASDGFRTLVAEETRVRRGLDAITYCLTIDGDRVEVPPCDGIDDYSDIVEQLFARFQQGETGSYEFGFSDPADMNHIEEQILDLVAADHMRAFEDMRQFSATNREFFDPAIALFDRELQFYLAYLDYIAPMKKAGLCFCRPRVTSTKSVDCVGAYDIALASVLVRKQRAIVTNDLALTGPERLLMISGPNQGGKTTFARMFGQLHYLGRLGLVVPGSKADLFLFDDLFTHFERGENIGDLRGKLQDDLYRVHAILERATASSLVILNEIFTSTTLDDARNLSRKILERLRSLDLIGIWVTFVEDIDSGPDLVTMVSSVEPEDPTLRTFRIVRAGGATTSDAIAIARKHRLTYRALKERLEA